ncbi:hypothetical protein BG004_001380 [Podila humilis]|nr:hypothetical protein BG004_001380 [Podila humilis]
MPSSTFSKRLFVFDFDWTLIEADSDHWIMSNHGREFCEGREAEFKTVQWTDLQEELLGKMYGKGVTTQDIVQSLQKIPLTPEIIAALRIMKASGAELCIISDANTFYIDTILKASRYQFNHDAFARLDLTKYDGHFCNFASSMDWIRPCAPNLCKGQELLKLIASKPWDQVIYMGDSTNDFCPSTRLQSTDIVLARSKLLLEEAIKASPELVKARVIYWDAPAAALAATQAIFNCTASKDLPVSAVAPVAY